MKINVIARLKQLWRIFWYGFKYRVEGTVEYDEQSAVSSNVETHWKKEEEEEFNKQNDINEGLTLKKDKPRHWVITPKRRKKLEKLNEKLSKNES